MRDPADAPVQACSPRTPHPPPTWGSPDTGRGHHPVLPRPGKGWRAQDPSPRNNLHPSCPQTASTISSPWSPRNGAHPDDHPPAGPVHTLTLMFTCTHWKAELDLHPSPAPEVRRAGLRSRGGEWVSGRAWEALAPPSPAPPESQMFQSTWVGPRAPGSPPPSLFSCPESSPPPWGLYLSDQEALGPRASVTSISGDTRNSYVTEAAASTLGSVLCDFCFFQKEEHRETQLSVKLHRA